MKLVVFVVLAACGTAPTSPTHALGMNDVSVLLPLPADAAAPVVATIAGDGTPIVDLAWFRAVLLNRRDLGSKTHEPFDWSDFHIVAIRFDLCDRATVGDCPADADGRLRLVAQPVVGAPPKALDVGAHLFYPIPAAELPDVIAELRELAALQAAPDSPLVVNAGDTEYLARLRALVLRYAKWDTLVRLTANGQNTMSAAFDWIFRGVDRDGDTFRPMLIPKVDAYQQQTQLEGGDTVFQGEFIADDPPGFLSAIDGIGFGTADAPTKLAAVTALVALENPLLHDAVDVQCMGCHVSTFLAPYRATEAGIDRASLPEQYTSSHDLAVSTLASSDARVIRGFGWIGTMPAISQRVANDTAHVADEIAARFAP